MRGAGNPPNEGFNSDGVMVEPTNLSTQMKWLATVTGRWGFANGPWLVYGKGGVAWARERHLLQEYEFDAELYRSQSVTQNRVGWIAGFGVEYGFYQNWSVKAEYNYLEFGKKKIDFDDLQGSRSHDRRSADSRG